jgi:UDP-glucose 4-epimerase
MPKYLVTGGAGFIGSNLVTLLLAHGHDVVVLDDLSSGYQDNLEPGVDLIVADVASGPDVTAAVGGCDAVFHLAASVGNSRSIENPVRDATTNVLGTLNVLEACRSAAIPRVVFSSSAGIFGELKTLPISEDHPQDPDSPYGVSKLAAEKACLVYNKLYGMRNVCLRYFNVYGPRQRFDAYGNVIPIFGERALTGQELIVFGDGEQTRDFVHVQDVAAANLAAGQSAASGAFNIGSGTRISINDLADWVNELTGAGVPTRHTEPRAGDVRDSLADTSAAAGAFGFSPAVDLKAGLAEYLEWLRDDPISVRARRMSA